MGHLARMQTLPISRITCRPCNNLTHASASFRFCFLGKHRISPAKRESPSIEAPAPVIEPVTDVPNTLEPELSTDLDTDSAFE